MDRAEIPQHDKQGSNQIQLREVLYLMSDTFQLGWYTLPRRCGQNIYVKNMYIC